MKKEHAEGVMFLSNSLWGSKLVLSWCTSSLEQWLSQRRFLRCPDQRMVSRGSLRRLAEAEWAWKSFPTQRGTRGPTSEWGQSPGWMNTNKKNRVMTAIFPFEKRVMWKRFWKPSLCGSIRQSSEGQTRITEKKSCFQIRKNFLVIHCSTLVTNWPGWSFKTSYNPVWDRSLSGESHITD